MRDRVAKTVSVLTGLATVLSVSGFLYLVPEIANAVSPKDYGLKEGNTISAAGSSDPDVYIVNDWGFKRLFLNPAIFGFYGHLGGFAKVKNVSAATRDAFKTSGLFRLDGDQKVYGIETTGEDTGMLHWVNTTGAQAVSDDADFFKKVFVINQKEFDWYSKGTNYTSVSQVPNYSRSLVAGATPSPSATPVPGAVTVSLASDNPAAASLTGKANGVTFLKLNFSGTGTLSSLRVIRKGPGATGDIANVYIYDGARRLTSGRSLSSTDGSVTFSGLNVAVSGSKTLSVVGDLTSSGATSGNVEYFSVESASSATLTSGTVGGSFPLNGNNMTITGQNGGGLTIDKTGSLANPNVGQTNVEVAEFKLTTATEGAKISRLQLLNGGTVKYTDINNLRLEVNGTKVATGAMTSDGYAVFDFGSAPYAITKGDNRIFKMYGDLNGKKSETVIFYFEVTADSLALGDQFGFGMSVTNNMGTTGTAATLTLQGGVLTISFIGPTATSVSTTTTKTHFLDFDMNAASNVELRKHTIILCKDNAGNGTYDANSDTTNGWSDIINIAIIDRDSGVTLVGPQDGSAFTTSNTSCPGGVAGAAKQFTDVFNISGGQTLHLAIVGDVKTANTGGVQITSGDIVRTVIVGYGTAVGSSGDLTIAKYTGTNTALVNTDIVPAGDINGNNMTVQSSTLTLSLASTPTGNLSYVKGTKAVNTLGLNFATALGNAVTITDLTLTGYVADSGTTMNKGVGAAPDASLNVGALAAQVRLIDASNGNSIGTLTTNNLSVSTGTAKFNNLNWAIPGGTTKTLVVQADLSTNNTSGSLDTFAFDIAATTDITALDANSNTINPNSAVNGTGTAPTTYVTVNSAGTLKGYAYNQPTSAAVYWNQKNAPYSNFRFTSTNEAFSIERLNFYSTSASNLVNNIDTLTISYLNKAGSTVTTNGTFNNAGSISFAFSGDARPYIPKDNSLDVAVSANLKSAAQLFRAGNVNFSIRLSVDPNTGGNGDEFRAVGEGSGSIIDGSTSGSALLSSTGGTLTSITSNAMYVYRSWPKFTGLAVADANASIIPGTEVYRFKVDAIGDPADGAVVFFDGATGNTSGSVKFAVLASGAVTNTLAFDLRDTADNALIATRSLSNANVTTALPTIPSASFRFQDVTANRQIQIPAGQSKTFTIKLNNSTTGFTNSGNTTSGRSADYVQVMLRDNENNLIYWTNNGGTDRNHSDGSTSTVLRDFSTTVGQRLRAR